LQLNDLQLNAVQLNRPDFARAITTA
jgi:hypothetical protein